MDGDTRTGLARSIPEVLRRQIERKSYIKLSTWGGVKLTLGFRIPEFMPYKEEVRDCALAEVLGGKEDERLLLELEFDTSLNLTNIEWEFITRDSIPPERIDELKEVYKVEEKKRMIHVAKGGKIGRNDPCPCASGKKYKKCHGK